MSARKGSEDTDLPIVMEDKMRRISRLRSRVEFLSPTDLDLIHTSTMYVLNEVGVVVPVSHALEVFKNHGVKVDGQRVHLDETKLMDAIAKAPAEFTIHA